MDPERRGDEPARQMIAASSTADGGYPAEFPPRYDLILEFTPERFCVTAEGPGLLERECVDLAPDAAEASSVFRRLAATAKLHDRVRRAGKASKSGHAR
jgi:hypothetical protein